MGPAAETGEDGFDVGEVGIGVGGIVAVITVYGDVAAGASGGGGEHEVVGRGGADLDGEADEVVAPVEEGADLAQRLRHGLEVDGVLHLAEPDVAVGDEDPGGGVGELSCGERATGDPVDRRHQTRRARTDLAQQTKGLVAQQFVVDVALDARRPGDRGVGTDPRVRLHQSAIGVREQVELVVVGGRDALLEGGDRRIGRLGTLDRVQPELVDTVDGQFHNDPERAEAECDGLHVGVVGGHGDYLAGAGDDGRADDLGADAAEGEPGAVGSGRGGAGDRLTIDVAEIGHRESERCQDPRDLVQVCAGAHGHSVAVDRDQTTQARQVELHVVGHGYGGEAVSRADGLHRAAASGRLPDDGGDLGGTRRVQHLVRRAGRGAAPVAPAGRRTRSGPAHRKHLPSPR